VSAIVLSLSTGACWSPPSPCAGGWAGLASSLGLSDGRTGAELLLCVHGGAVNVQIKGKIIRHVTGKIICHVTEIKGKIIRHVTGKIIRHVTK
jgi:hypothetical protein